MQQIIETDEGSCNDIDPQGQLELQQQQLQAPVGQHFSNSNSGCNALGTDYFGPIITWNEVSMGALIASGSFASVYKVSLNSTITSPVKVPQTFHRSTHSTFGSQNEDFDTIEDDFLLGEEDAYELHGTLITSSHHSYHSLTSPSTTQKPYALKRLNSIVLDVPAKINHGIKGMIFEAQLLSQILPLHQQGRSHPNIVSMIGMSPNFMNDPLNGFLILEYLVETLDNRLMRWMNRQTLMVKNNDNQSNEQNLHNIFHCHRLFDTQKKSKKKCTTLKEQLTRTKHVGYGVAHAIKYLHEHHVLYRDLKPSNVGFDERGTVKLFDFDLSRQFHCDGNDDSGAAKQLTGCIGSLRYMSPECAQGKPYGFSSDVHSFAILLWEICALQRPYEQVHTTPDLVRVAFLGNERPTLRKIASPTLKQLLQKSWNPIPGMRPTMSSIVDSLSSLLSNADSRSNGGSPTALRKLMTREGKTVITANFII